MSMDFSLFDGLLSSMDFSLFNELLSRSVFYIIQTVSFILHLLWAPYPTGTSANHVNYHGRRFLASAQMREKPTWERWSLLSRTEGNTPVSVSRGVTFSLHYRPSRLPSEASRAASNVSKCRERSKRTPGCGPATWVLLPKRDVDAPASIPRGRRLETSHKLI
jgi:hypothetical protein